MGIEGFELRIGMDETVHREMAERLSAVAISSDILVDPAAIAADLFEKHCHRSPEEIELRIRMHCKAIGLECSEA